MAGKSKRVKLQLEDPATGKLRTLEFTLPMLTSDCCHTNPLKQSVIIIRRRPRSTKLTKARAKVV
jgi:hypothetical protein